MEILTANQEKVPTTSRWQEELKSAIRDVDTLLKFVGLRRSELSFPVEPDPRFPILVPQPFARRIRKKDPGDPLLRQVLTFPMASTDQGNSQSPGNLSDRSESWKKEPLKDKSFEVAPGLLHKYEGRVLMLVTGACAIHCRYCFRQNFDYSTSRDGIAEAVDYIQNDDSISEVILSGGDPLLKTDAGIANLIAELEQVPHLRRLRIHTRTPVVLPSRITSPLLATLGQSRLSVSIVLHINHSREIDSSVAQMIGQLRSRQLMMLNQAVLLRGVNADFDSQFRLCESLVNLGIIPYYLHLLDRVEGAEEYLVDDQTGIRLIEKLRAVLPGYAVPRLVRETPGQPHKTVLERQL